MIRDLVKNKLQSHFPKVTSRSMFSLLVSLNKNWISICSFKK